MVGARTSAESLVGRRYQLINELGHGGAGVVYRAIDRLTGHAVTVKLLRGHWPVQVISGEEERLELADEFKVMSTLRHPNIVAVLDYGFDDRAGPYLVTQLLESAQTIVDASAQQPLLMRVHFLVQLMRALAYLHRRAFIHRDLTPKNALVVGEQVKLLDFGLSTSAQPDPAVPQSPGGTPLYMSPEVLKGAPATTRSDLYGAGVVAYEMFAGARPYDVSNWYNRIFRGKPDFSTIDPRVAPIISRLMDVDPAQRYASAEDVISALSEQFHRDFQEETIETRESYLRTALLVGRSEEIDRLERCLAGTASGTGALCLIGGESGVGKSRLMEELRTLALVRGILVLRGQAVRDGGSPYQLWRDVLRWLALISKLSSFECGVLSSVVEDIESLVGHGFPPAPRLEEAAEQTRLLATIEAVFRRQERPLAVFLEDLQWAGSESSRLLSWLAPLTASVPLLIVGTYRVEELPDLKARFPNAYHLRLDPLNRTAVGELSESILGAGGRETKLLERLWFETMGNPFAVVQILRTWAEEAGNLDRVAQGQIPELSAGGIKHIVERRLSRLSDAARALLRTAAVAGRRIDTQVIARLAPEEDVDPLLLECLDAGVLAIDQGTWTFAHDRLREALLDAIPPEESKRIHQRVAEAIEASHPGDPLQLSALAHHWAGARDADRAYKYADRAGIQALAGGAYKEAVVLLERATAHALTLPAPARDREVARLEALLTEAHYRMGDMAAVRRHAEQSLSWSGDPVPKSALGSMLRLSVELARFAWRAIRPMRAEQLSEEEREAVVRTARVHNLLAETTIFALEALPMAWSCVRIANQGARLGPSPQLAVGWLGLGFIMYTTRMTGIAARWLQRAEDMARATNGNVAYVISRNASGDINHAKLDAARERLERAVELSLEGGDRRLAESCTATLALVAEHQARHEDGLVLWKRAREAALHSGHREIATWALLGLGEHLVRLGRAAEALPLLDEALRDEKAQASEQLWGHGARALALLRESRSGEAWTSALRALEILEERRPFIYWYLPSYWTLPATMGTAEVFLEFWRKDGSRSSPARDHARRAVKHVAYLSRAMPLAKPAEALCRGRVLALDGRLSAAVRTWKRGAALAETAQLPHEKALIAEALGKNRP